MADTIFDTFGPVNRRRAMFNTSGSPYPDPSFVPDDTVQPDAAQTPQNNGLLAQEQQDQTNDQKLAAQQAKQAQADAAAQQKQQDAQSKIDQQNTEMQAKADADNSKSAGIVTKASSFVGPDGKAYIAQMPTANPDGTTAYKPTDLGIQPGPDGSAYRVHRNQWGAQDWSDPYQAGENANVALNPQGQIIATPKGKDAASLPKQDVTMQGVTGGNDPNNPDIQVAPNAPLNRPDIVAGINAEEKKLLTGNADGTGKTGAAGQQVADTVGADADDATQKASDASANFTAAVQDHRDAASALRDAASKRDGTDAMDKAYQNAVDDEARARQALAAASQAKASTKLDADSKTAISKKAKADPLGYLLAKGDLPSTNAPQPSPSVSSQSAAPANWPSDLPPEWATMTGAQLGQVNPKPGQENQLAKAIELKASQETGTQIDQPSTAQTTDATASPSQPAASASPDDSVSKTSNGPVSGSKAQPLQSSALPPQNAHIPPDSSSGSATNPNQIFGSNGQPIGEVGLDGQLKPYRQVGQPGRPGGLQAPKTFVGPEAPAHTILALSDNVANAVAQGLGESLLVPTVRAQAMIHDLVMTGHGPRPANPNDGWDGRATQSDEDRMADLATSVVENPHLQSKDAGKLGNFLTKTAPAGVASTVGTISVAGGDPVVMAGLMGLSGGTSGYYDATAKGADPKTALASGAYGATVNTLMGLAMGGGSKVAARLAFGKNADVFLQGAYKPTVTEAAKYLAADGGAQALLGGSTQLGTNAVAKTLYDPNRPMLDGVVNAAGQQAVFSALHFPTLAGALLNSSTRGSIQRDTLNLAHAVDQLHSLQVTGGQTLDAINAYRAKMAADTASAINANDALSPEAKAAARKGIYTTWSPMSADEFKSLQTSEDGSLRASPDKIQAAADRVNQLQARLQKNVGNILANAPKPTPAEKAQANALIPSDVQQQQSALDQFNSTRPEGTAPATTDTLQKASDFAPLVNPGADMQPGSEHFVPIAHEIEGLPDPDAQATATAMIKATNGRALTDAERGLIVGDPNNGVAPQVVDANTGQPFAKVTPDGRTILTDPGLARIKQLVPSASDILPRSEQSQIEAPQPIPPPVSKKGGNPAQATPEQASVPAGSDGGSPPASVPPPDPRLAHLSDETLQTRVTNMTAAMLRAKAGGGNLPPSAQAELARLQGEIASRSQTSGDDGSSVGAEPGAKVGDEVPYSRVNGEGKTVQSRGEITDASSPAHYKIVDADDGIERTVPFSQSIPRKPIPSTKEVLSESPVDKASAQSTTKEAEPNPATPTPPEYPDDALRNKVRSLAHVVMHHDSPAARDRLAEAQAELHSSRASRGEKIDVGVEARKLGVTIIGDTDHIPPEHREVVMRAVTEFARYRKAFDAVGVDSICLVRDFGSSGMMVVNRGPGETEFHLAPDRLAQNWDGTPSPKAWLPKLMQEEYLHAATFDLLTKDFQTMGLGRDEWSMFIKHFGGKISKELEQAHGGTLAAEVRDQYGDVDGVNLVLEFVRREVQKRLNGITTEDTFRDKPYTASFLRRLVTYIKGKLGLGKDVPQELKRMIAALEGMAGEALKANDLPPMTPEERVREALEPEPQVANEDEDRRARAIGAGLRPGQQTTLPSGRVVARDEVGNLVMREAGSSGVSARRIPGDTRLDSTRLTTPDIDGIVHANEQPELQTSQQRGTTRAEESHLGDSPDVRTSEAGGVPSSRGDRSKPVPPEPALGGSQVGGESGSGEPVPASPERGERPGSAGGEQSPTSGEADPAETDYDRWERERGESDANSPEQPGRAGRGNDAGGTAGASGGGKSVSRKLPEIDAQHPVNRVAASRSLDEIKADGLFPKENARFVSQDGSQAYISKAPKGKFRVSYFDPGAKKPWTETKSHTSLENAVRDVTGRGYYHFGKDADELTKRLAASSPAEVGHIVGDKNAVDEDQLHVALASLTDQGKTAQADAVQRELEFRQDERARIQHEQEYADAIHEHLGPSLAEHVAESGGLPKPGTSFAGELGAVKPNAKIDKKRVGSAGKVPSKSTEYSQLYDAYRSLMNTPMGDLNRYQQNLKRTFAKNPLFADEPKLSATDMAKSARGNAFFKDGSGLDDKSFIEALREDIEGIPHYPDHGTAATEGQAARGASPVDSFDRQHGVDAAQDYLDKNDELPFWLHQAVGKLFKSAMTRGSQAVDALIHRLQSGPEREPYPVAVGRGRKETDGRSEYLPNLPEGTTREHDNLAQGISSALTYRDAQQARLQPVLAKALDIGSTVYQSVKNKADWLGRVSDRLGTALAGDAGVLPNVFDFLSKHAGILSPAERELESNRLADQFVRDTRFGKGSDQFDPREDEFGEPASAEQVAPSADDREEYEKELSQKLNQPAEVRTSPSEEARVNRLVSAGIKVGQNRFVFTDRRGKSAQVYASADGSATVYLPGDSMFAEPKTPFSDVHSAIEHLVDQGFEFQSKTLEKKLTRDATINRFVAMVMGGLRLGQRRFHFDHEDGRTAALIARKDGKFTVAGVGETQKFQSVSAATAFLHDRGFGMMSSKLERNLRDKGLHPDQANDPIPYTDRQKTVINQYRRAKGLPVMGAKPFDGLDPKRNGFKEDRGVFMDPAADDLPAHVRGNVDAFADSIRDARYPNQRVRIDDKRGSTVLAYANPAIHPDTISVNTGHSAFQAFGGLKPEVWHKVASEEYWHNMHCLAARKMGAPFGQLMQDIFREMTPQAVEETMHEYGGGVLMKRTLGQYPDNFPPSLRFEVATEYARKLSQVLDDDGTSEQLFHPELDVPMSDQTRDIVDSNPQAKTRYPLLSGLLDTSRKIDNEYRTADVTSREDIQGNQSGQAATDQRTSSQRVPSDFGRGEESGGDIRPGRTDEKERGTRGSSDLGSDGETPRTQGPVGSTDVQPPLTQEAAHKIYRALSALKAKGMLNEGQGKLLERAERTLGQKFIDGLDDSTARPTSTKGPALKVKFGRPDTGVKHELEATPGDFFDQRPEGQQSLFGAEPVSDRDRNIQKLLAPLQARIARGEELSPNEKLGYQNLLKAQRQERNLPTGDFFDTPLFSKLQHEARETGPDGGVRFNDGLPLAKNIARSYRIPGLEPSDVEQEAAIGLLKAVRTYDPSKAEDRGFDAYAKAVIKNHLANEYRKRSLRREDTTLDAPVSHDEEQGETGTSQLPDSSQDTNRVVQRREMSGALRDAVTSLPDSAQKVMNGMLEGKASAEIADDMGVSPQRVSTLYQQAREKLRQRLADLGYTKADIRDLTVHGAKPFEHDFDNEPLHAMETPRQKHWAENAFGFKAFAKDDVIPAAKAVADAVRKAGDSMLKVFAPTLRSAQAAKMGRSLRAHLAWAAHERDMAFDTMRKARAMFQGMTVAECHDFIHAVETDTPFSDPKLADVYQMMRTLNRQRTDLARSMPARHFAGLIENYMPHIWKDDPETQAAALKYYQHKIEGNRAFLRHRSIPTVREGLDLGFKLVSDNPVDLFLTRFAQMDKYVVGQRILEEGKENGTLLRFDRPEDAPIGYRRIDPRIGLSTEFQPDPASNPELPGMKGMGTERRVDAHYYAPDEVCQVLENHLSPGLRNNPNEMISTPYKVIMGIANTMNQAQLGLSAFHLGFTTYDTMVSQLALAMKQAVPRSAGGLGQPMDAAKNLITLPLTPFTNILKGDKLLKEWLAPGTQGDEFSRIVESAIQGGARAMQDPIYNDGFVPAFRKAWSRGNLPGMTWRAPFAAIELASKPIMEYVVPRQKLGVFFNLMKADMKNLGPDTTEDQLREIAQRNWDSVDNRMGQLVYDNLFWDKTAKDLAMSITRSVGWNLGTYREIGGSIPDAGAYIRDLMSGKHPQFTNRMAYTLALNTMTPVLGSIACYLLTGKAPASIYDAYFPPTGEKDANGHDVRVAAPSYAKYEFADAHDPAGTIENKLNPIWASSLQLLHNKDYYGTEIVHSDDPWWKQSASVAQFAAGQLEPFAWSGGNKFAQAIPPSDNIGPLRKLVGSNAVHTALAGFEIPKGVPFIGGNHVLGAPTFGLTPAPAWMSQSPAEIRAGEMEARLHAGDLKTSDEAAKFRTRSALRTLMAQSNGDSKVVGPAIKAAIKSGAIKPGDIAKLSEDSKLPPLVRMARDIAGEYSRKGEALEGYQALKSVWDKATPAEQRSLARFIMPLYDKVAKTPGAKVGPRPVVKAEAKALGAELSMAR